MNTRRMFYVLAAVLIVSTTLVTACAPAKPALGTDKNPIVMSFVPSGDTTKITLGGEQLAKLLKDKTGLTYKITLGTSFGATVEAMGAGQAQIGWLNTYSYLLAKEKYGVQVGLVTVRNKSDFYNGQIMVNNASGIKTLADLKGKKFCYVDPNSTSGYVVPRIVMKAGGVDPDKDLAGSTNAGSHNNVAIAVYKKDCDAGATFVDARDGVAKDFPDIKDKTSVLVVSPQIPNDTVSFTKDFPADLKTKTVKAMLDIAQTDDGKNALNTIYQIQGFTEQTDAFFNDFRETLKKAGVDPASMVK